MERITTEALANAFIDEQVKLLREQIGDKKVLLALSGDGKMDMSNPLMIMAMMTNPENHRKPQQKHT